MTKIYVDADIQALRDLHRETLGLDRKQFSIHAFLGLQAQTILDGHLNGNEAVTFHLSCWCPQFIGQPVHQIMNATLSLDLARQTIAREYGYTDWEAIQTLGELKYDNDFEQAVDWVVSGRIESLSELLTANPVLVHQTSQHPHLATLLHYLAANGVESHRQITPLNAAEMATYLVQAGSDVNAASNIYGGGSTVLSLLLTSAHPANAGVLDDVSSVLRLAGAK